jgi:hypothetical protein
MDECGADGGDRQREAGEEKVRQKGLDIKPTACA